MRPLRAWLRRLTGSLVGRSRRDRELADEIASHIELHTADNLRAGMTPEEARRQALLRFGPVESIKESYRDRRGLPAVEAFWRDLRLALRSLRRDPGFALVVVVTLGLGIGAIAAVFSLAYGVVLSPLPYADPQELVWLGHVAPGVGLDDDIGMAPGFYTAYRERSNTLADVGIWRYRQRTLTGDRDPEVVVAAEATSTFFSVLGARPLLGRVLQPDDDRAVAGRVAVIGHALWQRRYGADPDIIGARVDLDNQPTTIVGVMPADFFTPVVGADLWLDGSAFDFDRFGSFSEHAVGRMRPGVTLEEVRLDLDAVIDTVKETMPEAATFLEELRVAAIPAHLDDRIVGGVERTFWLLLGSVGIVLAVACANVANLLLVRADGRRRDVAVRRALGASRLQVARHMLAESAVLTFLGGVVGLGLAAIGVHELVRWAPVDIPRLNAVGIDPVVLLFVFALMASLAIVLGLAPLLEPRTQAGRALRDDGRTATAGRARLRLRRAMLAGQVALALLLIVGAGLLVRSFRGLSAVDPGFDAGGVLTFELSLPAARYETSAAAADFHVTLLQRLEALPGVTSAAATRKLPLRGLIGGNTLFEEGAPTGPSSLPPVIWLNRATAGYFETLRIPLLRGRTLRRADLEQRTNALVINEATAELYWPGEDPLGKRVTFYRDEPVWSTIVGVVGNTKAETLDEEPQPMAWASPLGAHYDEARTMSYAVRTGVPPLSLADEVRRLTREADPGLAVVRLQTAQSIVDAARAPMAFTMILLLLAAAVALALGAVGVYGVTAYAVRQRTAEIGVRMALGARGIDVRRQLLTENALLAAVGVAFGLGASSSVGWLTESLLYAVDPLDPLAHVAATTLLLAVVGVATWIPALTASRVDPVTALRD